MNDDTIMHTVPSKSCAKWSFCTYCQATHGDVGECLGILEEGLMPQIFHLAIVHPTDGHHTDEQHRKVPDGTQLLWRAVQGELTGCLPQADQHAQTDCNKVNGRSLHVSHTPCLCCSLGHQLVALQMVERCMYLCQC